jgi:biopolymer transport protein ExbD
MRHLVCAVLLSLTSPALADEFDRLEGEALARVPGGEGVKKREALSFEELGQLEPVLPGTRAPLVVVRTGRKNLCRLLVSPGLRKEPGSAGEPAPVVVLERFDTFEGPRAVDRIARGKDLLVFDGFRVDLDAGLVVPEGQGGDVQFLAGGEGGPRLVALPPAELYTVSKSPLPAKDAAKGPSPGRGVVAADFVGTYQLITNGQWSGRLDLQVGGDGSITGRFRSDQTGTTYPVAGAVAAPPTNRLRFTITYPRTKQSYEGYLWTEGKGAISGVATMTETPYGFLALREGVRLGVEGRSKPAARSKPLLLEVDAGGHFSLDGEALEADALGAALRRAAEADPAAALTLEADDDAPYRAVRGALAAAEAAGLGPVRMSASKDPKK